MMGKTARMTLKTQRHLYDPGGAAVSRQGLASQILNDDLFNPFDIIQVKGQGPTTSLVTAQSTVLLGQT